MKLALQLQMLPNANQKADLLSTMVYFNEAASFAARTGFEANVFGQVSIHRLCYRTIRERFNLSAQMAVRSIAKAVETFRRDKTRCPVFKPHGAITYDQRVLSFKGLTEVSLWGLSGRHRMSFVCGAYQKALQGRIKGQTDLIYRDKKFFLLCTIDLPDGALIEPKDVLGVDLGIVNVATDSTGETFSGARVEETRQRYAKRRRVLNKVGTKSARRRLSKIRRREANFRRNENHCISKRLVAKAKATASVIALEKLKGIRERVTVNSRQRAKHSSWAFHQLRSFVEYKARLAGVPVVSVDPHNTSRTCSACGHCEKANRRSQAEFCCKHCNYSTNADFNAARNIRAKGVVKHPMVGLVEAKTEPLQDCG
ncbi:MAG: transposase [Patescibacteria group bacterium]|nr:transposase [Patescibacteria group bacterium]